MLVFTNGCFDIIHAGHIDFLDRARALGTKLVVGINSDASVRAIKGVGRPVNNQEARKAVLLGLKAVDDVVVFDESTPERVIESVKPDILVKGGDWKPNEIIGADFVQSYGGQVHSLPLKDGYSTSAVVERIKARNKNTIRKDSSGIEQTLNEHIDVIRKVLAENGQSISDCANLIWQTFTDGNKVLICGNGGSAADAQHIAAEFVGRYENERRALPAIALTTDTSALTALANDYDFECIFARQVDALARDGDLLIAISTSGNSPNVIAAVMSARRLGCKVIAMTGSGGKKLAALCDASIMIPSARTARVQEAHITVAHIWCEIIEGKLSE